MPLTETAIRRLPVPSAPVYTSDGGGLYLKSYPTGRRTWQYRTRKGGQWRVVTLGEWPSLNLNSARIKAGELRSNTLPDAMTFGQLLNDWYEKRIEPRYRVTKNIEVYVNRAKPIANVQLLRLTTPALVRELQTYAKAAPVAANRCLSNWKLALDYGVEIGAIDANPLARTTARVIGGEETSRDRTLTDDEIRWLFDHADNILKFLLLTGLRISEAQHGQHEGEYFRIERTKNGDPHWVYLPPLAATQICEEFTVSPTAVQSKLRRQLDKADIERFTPHDLRRTFATRLAGMGCPPHVVEKMLNHRMQGVMAVYNRHEYEAERIEWARRWADTVEVLING